MTDIAIHRSLRVRGRRARLATLLGVVLLLPLVVLLAACSTSAGGGGTDDIVSQVRLVDGERFVYRLLDLDGELVGRGTFTTTRNGDTFELRQSYADLAPAGAGSVVDESLVVVDAATLQPVTMQRTIQPRGGDDARTGELRLREHYYEDQSSLWLWRTLAFDEDLELRYTAVDPREGSQVTAALMQVDRQLRETPAGSFDSWVIQIRTGRETVNVWVHVQPPHEVVRFDNGRLFFELESVEVPAPQTGKRRGR